MTVTPRQRQHLLEEPLLALQNLAAVLACSDKRFLPATFRDANRSDLRLAYETARERLSRR